MVDSQTARIPASVETRDRLKARKNGGETYDDVLQRLLDGEGRGDGDYHTPEHVAEYVAEQFDCAAIAGMTADEVVERLRSEMG